MPGELNSPYPKPGPMGGRLIRRAIARLREAGVRVPLDSHILIAVSGGSDSIALGHLLARYGRRVVARERIELVHFNHGWRGAESDADEAHVRAAARRWGVKCRVIRLKKPGKKAEKGWEAFAREDRVSRLERLAAKHGAIVLTAHHADDLAETLVWRLFTGAAGTHGGGILARDGCFVRPLLGIRKRELARYLVEEGETWREDSTNSGGRFLRSRMRVELMPLIETLFPRAVEHLVALGLGAQGQGREGAAHPDAELAAFFGTLGLRMKRTHWQALDGHAERLPGPKARELQLPGGWLLTRARGVSQPKDNPSK
jgi:tRNA(Ile)-lysidine synthase